MRDAEMLAGEVVALATGLGLRIAAAESLTGGMLASTIVSVPGASSAFSGGVVAYDTSLKETLLAVDPALLRERGPVDGEVARQMAAGVRIACAVGNTNAASLVSADIGVATTGVAGPSVDPQSGQPAGTVWLGVSSRLGDRSVLLAATGRDRASIRRESVLGALELLCEELAALAAVPSTETQ